MLKIRGLVKEYKTGFFRSKVRVLHDVNLTVHRGEIYGFVGHNGAGKTTTFKVMLGFSEPTSGAIEIMGRPHTDVGLKARLGYLPENPYFYDYLTGEELLRYVGELHGIPHRRLRVRVDELLEKVKLTHARGVQLRKYSKGMLQRIGIAQALINDPDFLVLDEPMSGLDPVGQREMKDVIVEEKSRGKTIVLSSHILSDLEALCDRVGVIMHGRTVKEGTLGELIKEVRAGYEMLLAGVDDEMVAHLAGLGVEVSERAGMVVLSFPEEAKGRVLKAVVDGGAEVVSLYPSRKPLEELFKNERQ